MKSVPSRRSRRIGTAAILLVASGAAGAALFIDIDIVRGVPVSEGALEQVVGLTYGNAREPLCSGVVIGPKVVLTAAHCVCQQLPTHVFLGKDPAVGAGGRSEYYPVVDARSAAPCDEDTRGRDFALVTVDRPFHALRPMQLAAATTLNHPASGRIAGFGAYDSQSRLLDFRKRHAAVPIRSVRCEAASDVEEYGCFRGSELVAGRLRTADTCRGDSGGPFMVTQAGTAGTGEAGAFVIAAITSRAVRDEEGCGNGGIYSLMDARARAWIEAARTSLKA